MTRPTFRTVAVLAVAVGLCGCIVMKEAGAPDPDRRDNIDERAGEAFRAGLTTREDVLLALGEPAAAADDGRWLEYRSSHNFGHWSFYGCGAYSCGGFDLGDTIRHRMVTVYFDAAGRVREVDNVDRLSSRPPELRLVDRHVQALVEPGEGVLEPLPGARWWVAGRWRPGVIVLTDRALLFLESTESGPAYRLGLRLAAADVRSADWADDPQAPGQPCAQVQRADGRSELFALAPLPADPAPAVPGADRERTQRFIDQAGWLPWRDRRSSP